MSAFDFTVRNLWEYSQNESKLTKIECNTCAITPSFVKTEKEFNDFKSFHEFINLVIYEKNLFIECNAKNDPNNCNDKWWTQRRRVFCLIMILVHHLCSVDNEEYTESILIIKERIALDLIAKDVITVIDDKTTIDISNVDKFQMIPTVIWGSSINHTLLAQQQNVEDLENTIIAERSDMISQIKLRITGSDNLIPNISDIDVGVIGGFKLKWGVIPNVIRLMESMFICILGFELYLAADIEHYANFLEKEGHLYLNSTKLRYQDVAILMPYAFASMLRNNSKRIKQSSEGLEIKETLKTLVTLLKSSIELKGKFPDFIKLLNDEKIHIEACTLFKNLCQDWILEKSEQSFAKFTSQYFLSIGFVEVELQKFDKEGTCTDPDKILYVTKFLSEADLCRRESYVIPFTVMHVVNGMQQKNLEARELLGRGAYFLSIVENFGYMQSYNIQDYNDDTNTKDQKQCKMNKYSDRIDDAVVSIKSLELEAAVAATPLELVGGGTIRRLQKSLSKYKLQSVKRKNTKRKSKDKKVNYSSYYSSRYKRNRTMKKTCSKVIENTTIQ